MTHPRHGKRALQDLVGRARDLALVQRLVGEGAPLVTLLGPAGVGKTALARQFVAVHESAGPPGSTTPSVVWCDVTEANGPDALCATLASELGIPLERASSATSDTARVAILGDALGAEPRLLVLDNFEHLVPIAERTVGEWLARAPELQIVVTSREQLRLGDECVHELAPLGVPASDTDVLESDSVILWLARVRARDPDYRIPKEEIPIVGRLARELDGLPLAIELAAARSAVLSPSMLVARLDQRFEILKNASPSVPPRHKALRAAIDVSWNLLGDDGRSVLAQCSVFRDGFSLEAAEAIVDLSHVDGARSTLDVLQDLREKSLVQVQAAPSLAGEQRFGMVLSIRAYAEEKLALEGRGRDVQARHARWFLALAERLSRAAEGPDAATSHRTLALERENLSLVLRNGLERSTEDIETVLRVLVALEHHFLVEGLLVAQLPTLTSALERADQAAPALLGRALVLHAEILIRAGRLADAERDARRALEVAAAERATGTEARAHAAIALLRTRDGKFDEAEAAAEAARAKADASGDGWVVGFALARSAGLARTRGDVHLASRYSEAAATAFRGAGADLHARLATLTLLGCFIDVGQLERARTVAEHALATDTSSDAFSSLTRPQFLLLQGSIELELGQLDRAMTALKAGLALALARGDTWLASWLRGYAAFAARERGAMREALAELDEAVAGLAKIEPLNAHVLSAIAGATEADLDRVDAARERIDAAGRLLGASIDNDSRCVLDLCLGHVELAEARRARSGGDAADADRLETSARARLEAARAKGPPTAEHPDGTPPATARGYGARRMARSLARALSGTLLAMADAPPRVRLDAEGSWVEPPGGIRVSCERRPVLRRLLLALARAHRETPGRPVPLRALLEAGWPGERIRADAAKNRLYMMVSRLRALGLGESLRAEGDGYLLAPELEVELVARASS